METGLKIECPGRGEASALSLWQVILLQLGVAAVYFLLARIVHSYFASNIASVLWPSSGLALAVLLLGGKRYAWGVFLGALLTHLYSDHSLWTPVLIAAGNTLEALLGACLLTRFSQFDVNLNHPRDYLCLALLGGCLASLSGALIGPVALLIAGIFTLHNVVFQMVQWWMGDVLGVILIAPLILVWRKWPEDRRDFSYVFEFIVFFIIAYFVGSVLFLGWFSESVAVFYGGFWMFLFVTWAAVRLGMHAVLLMVLLVAVQGLLGAYAHIGYFADDLERTQLVNFWFYIVTLTVVGMSLASFIKSQQLSRQTLSEQEAFFRMIAENVDDYIAVLDRQGRRLYNSPSYGRLFGALSFLNPCDSFAEIHPDDRERIRQVFNETVATGLGQRAEFRFVLPDGDIRVMESRGGVVRDKSGQVLRVVVVSHDVTERKLADEKIHKLAFYDALTQLPNRRLLDDRLAQVISSSKRSGSYAALLFLDLDNFKPLNDTYGHTLGDVLLIEVARRLSRCVREVDTVARFGGDEFVVVLSELDSDRHKSASEARGVAEKIASALAQPYRLKYQTKDGVESTVLHHCTASIGVNLFLNHEHGQTDLLKWADMAMYQAKKNGRNQICFPDNCAAVSVDGNVSSLLCQAKSCPRAMQ